MIELQQLGKFDLENSECEFIAHFEHFNIKGTIDCEIEHWPGEEETGLKDGWSLFTCNYWYLEIYNDGGKIGIFDKEKQSCLNDVENYFDELVQNF